MSDTDSSQNDSSEPLNSDGIIIASPSPSELGLDQKFIRYSETKKAALDGGPL